MAYIVLYFDEALNDVKEAKKWYKDQKDGFRDEFTTAIEKR